MGSMNLFKILKKKFWLLRIAKVVHSAKEFLDFTVWSRCVCLFVLEYALASRKEIIVSIEFAVDFS